MQVTIMCYTIDRVTQVKKKYILYPYLGIHIILYLLIYVVHVFPYDVEIAIDYSVIVSCFLMVFFFLCIEKKVSSFLLCIAFFFTVISDTILLWLDNDYEWALLSFILVQFTYFIYILYTLYDKRNWKRQIDWRLGIVVPLCILYFFLDCPNRLLICLVIFYIIQLLWNVILSLRAKNKFLSIGLILFLLCDICVGCMNIIDFFPTLSSNFFDTIAHSTINFSWLFYHPSQVLLSLCDQDFF